MDGETLDIPARAGGDEHGHGQKGLSPEDYRKAVQQAGTMAGAGRILDVNDKTVREQCIRCEIEDVLQN